ncbi:SDR family NAD(P)-dependent oxidoreductase [Actinokineospora pegani]|uniref:SDR family NAD(P)-dependent oxidoreductase n=1 Tax=Actinokineospora pegani TaxID=2654637 RepID=UPI0018D3BFA8|nr:SDR family oxidoreductase [Actinokineospora pegani]
MRLRGRVVAITGGASGLGAALAVGAHDRGAAAVAVLDLDTEGARSVAQRVGGLGVTADVADPDSFGHALRTVGDALGPVDVFIANAGVMRRSTVHAPDAEWDLAWRVHVLSVAWAAQELTRTGRPVHLGVTASTAAVAPNPKSAVYSVTKHAQLALAEWLGAAYRGRGLSVTCFCPGGIRTPMLAAMAADDPYTRAARAEADPPEVAAAAFLDGIESDRALATTKPRTREEIALRGADYEAWLHRAAGRFADSPSPLEN